LAPRPACTKGGADERWLEVEENGWTAEEDRWRRRIRDAPRCGELDGGLDGAIVWLACDCGAAVIKCQEGSEADCFR
jgi:hypothetical protein